MDITKDKMSALEGRIESISEQNTVLSKEKEIIKDDNARLEQENERLSNESEIQKDEIENLLTKASELSEKIEDLQIDLHEAHESIALSTTQEKEIFDTPIDDGWQTMVVEASGYTMVANGDKMGGTGLTSTGTVPTAHRTIAVDPNVIPYGSLIRYNGVTYTAEDTGGLINGNKVDIYFDTLDECLSFGRINITIEVNTAYSE